MVIDPDLFLADLHGFGNEQETYTILLIKRSDVIFEKKI